MHIIFHELLLTLVLRKARGAPVAQMVNFKHAFALIVSIFAIQLLHCVTKTIANMAVICVINCEKLRIQNICSRVSVTMDRAPPLLLKKVCSSYWELRIKCIVLSLFNILDTGPYAVVRECNHGIARIKSGSKT